ncbi:MAG TPA: exodeoxyribonuclease VII small subunit [Acidisarcina sp.]
MATFEDSLKQLETIVDQLERGDLPLEDSVRLFELGVKHSTACKQELDAAEGKVQILIKQRDGSMKGEPFPPMK